MKRLLSLPDMRRRPSDSLAVFGATFIVYALGACRTIYVGDSGELVAAAATLGIPHPSGYPLYVLLGHLWISLLPLGSVAFRMSLFSAFFAAAACAVLYAVCRRSGVARPVAWAATLLFAFSPSFWSQAGIQRVYSLNAFFVLAVVGLALEWYRSRDIRWMAAAALVAGLGACNHTVVGVVGAAVGLFAVAAEPTLLRRPKDLALCIGAGLVGLLPYAYLPLRSRREPRLDWGDPETLRGFLDVVLRRDFWHRAWIETPADAVAIGVDWLASLGVETAFVGAALAVWALVAGRRTWPVALPVLVMLANVWVVGSHGSRSDIFIWHRYYIPSYAMVVLLAAWGGELAWRRWRLGGRRWGAAVLLLPALLLVSSWNRFDRSDFRIAEDFSRTLLQTLPPGAHLAASDDNILFVLIYLHLVEGVRPDVDLILQGVGDADLPPLRFDPDDDPLFFTHHPNWDLAGIEVLPVGLVYRTVRPGVRTGVGLPDIEIPKSQLDGAWDPRVPKDYLTQNLIGHFHFMLGVNHEEADWPTARAEFQRAVSAAPRNDVLFYNLGLIYRRNGLAERALASFERAREINPRHIPSSKPVRSADKVAELRDEVRRLQDLRAALGADLDLPTILSTAAGQREMAGRILAAATSPEQRLWARGHQLRAQELEAGLETDGAELGPP